MGVTVPDHAQTADLPTISFAALTARDPEELQKLVKACETMGFFYLDLRGAASKDILHDWRSVLDFMALYFGQDLATKMLDNRESDTHGYVMIIPNVRGPVKAEHDRYEPVGTSAGARPGQVDAYETLKVARGELQDGDPKLPSAVVDRAPLFHRFVDSAHFVVLTLLACLSDALGLEEDARFEHSHRSDHPSRTTLVMFRYPQDEKEPRGVGHNKHTDIGTLTLLFSEQYGLQVLSPETNHWQFIEPKPEHTVINVGDSLRFLSKKRFWSCVHRVIPTEQTQPEHRYSIAYFLRAEDEAVYVDSHGQKISAKDWHDNKYEVFRQRHDQQEKDSILTGGMEKREHILNGGMEKQDPAIKA